MLKLILLLISVFCARAATFEDFERASKQLDEQHRYANNRITEGHSGQSEAKLQQRVLWSLATMNDINHICEIGFNAGHSSLLFMVANPSARVTSFDIGHHKYTMDAESFIKSGQFKEYGVQPQNLKLIYGDSAKTVPASTDLYGKCDLLFIDGGHFHHQAVNDIVNMKPLANRNKHVVVIDDTNCKASWCVDKAVNMFVDAKVLKSIKEYPIARGRGFSIMRYINM